MIKHIPLAFLALTLFVCGVAPAQDAAPKKPAVTRSAAEGQNKSTRTPLPSAEEIDSYMKRNFGYDPAVSWQIISIQESVVPGIPEVVVSVNKQAPVHI